MHTADVIHTLYTVTKMVGSTHTLRDNHHSLKSAKTMTSMHRCNNIVIHLGWCNSSQRTCLATDVGSDLSALATLVRKVLLAVSMQHNCLAVSRIEATARFIWFQHCRATGSTERETSPVDPLRPLLH